MLCGVASGVPEHARPLDGPEDAVYTTLLLLDLVKTGKVRENEGLPPVFPIVIYNGGKAWKAPQEVATLFAPMPESLKYYRPQHRHFLLDESRVPGEELDKSKGLAAQLLRLERAQEPEQVRQIVRELIARLHGPGYLPYAGRLLYGWVVLSLNALE